MNTCFRRFGCVLLTGLALWSTTGCHGARLLAGSYRSLRFGAAEEGKR